MRIMADKTKGEPIGRKRNDAVAKQRIPILVPFMFEICCLATFP